MFLYNSFLHLKREISKHKERDSLLNVIIHEHIYVETKRALCIHFGKKNENCRSFLESENIEARSYCGQIL